MSKPMRPGDFQIVYQTTDRFDEHVGPWGGEQVGIRILDRIIWLAARTFGKEKPAEFEKWENIANLMVSSAQRHVRENLLDLRQLRDDEK
jgi:hypothetical protein